MKTKAKTTRTKGSALFMVICMMSIMLVVVMTAMAMVSVAHTKSLQNYSSSQSYVSAKNVMDTFVNAMGPTSSLSDTEKENLFGQLYNWYIADPTTLHLGKDDMSTAEHLQFTVSDIPEGLTSGGDASERSAFVDMYLWDVKTTGTSTGNPEVQIKLKTTVTSGAGDTEQTRTLVKTFYYEFKIMPTSLPFDCAVKTNGTFSPGGTRLNVIGPATIRQGSLTVKNLGPMGGLQGMTYINGDLIFANTPDATAATVPSLTVAGTLEVQNALSIMPSSTNAFIYCEELEWQNAEVNSGFSIISVGDATFNNQTTLPADSPLYVGGDLNFSTSTHTLNAPVYCWGDINLGNGVTDNCTVYMTAGSTLSALGSSITVSETNKSLTVNGKTITVEIIDETTYPVSCLTTDLTKYDGTNDNYTLDIQIPHAATSKQFAIETEVSKYVSITSGGVSEDSSSPIGCEIDVSDAMNAKEFASSELGVSWPSKDPLTGEVDPMDVDVVIDPSTLAPGTTVTLSPGDKVYLKGGSYDGIDIEVVGSGDKVVIFQDEDVDLSNCNVTSEAYRDMAATGTIDATALGVDPNYTPIYWLVSGSSTTLLYDAGGSSPNSLSTLNAYIYSVGAGEVNVGLGDTTCNGTEYTVLYTQPDGSVTTSTTKVAVAGGITGENVTCGIDGAIVFIGANGAPPLPPPTYDPTDYNFSGGVYSYKL